MTSSCSLDPRNEHRCLCTSATASFMGFYRCRCKRTTRWSKKRSSSRTSRSRTSVRTTQNQTAYRNNFWVFAMFQFITSRFRVSHTSNQNCLQKASSVLIRLIIFCVVRSCTWHYTLYMYMIVHCTGTYMYRYMQIFVVFLQVYIVNLLRRPDRRRLMLSVFDELGIEAEIVDAIDGRCVWTVRVTWWCGINGILFRTLNDSYVENLGIKMLDGYTDPFSGR